VRRIYGEHRELAKFHLDYVGPGTEYNPHASWPGSSRPFAFCLPLHAS
jgi:hypothetical protein